MAADTSGDDDGVEETLSSSVSGPEGSVDTSGKGAKWSRSSAALLSHVMLIIWLAWNNNRTF